MIDMKQENLVLRRNDNGEYCLHTSDGVPLSNQTSVHFHQSPGELASITATFYCDGERVSLADEATEK